LRWTACSTSLKSFGPISITPYFTESIDGVGFAKRVLANV
jgi:hypothetical protein